MQSLLATLTRDVCCCMDLDCNHSYFGPSAGWKARSSMAAKVGDVRKKRWIGSYLGDKGGLWELFKIEVFFDVKPPRVVEWWKCVQPGDGAEDQEGVDDKGAKQTKQKVPKTRKTRKGSSEDKEGDGAEDQEGGDDAKKTKQKVPKTRRGLRGRKAREQRQERRRRGPGLARSVETSSSQEGDGGG